MGVVTVSVIIDAAPGAIWEYIEQIERHVEWMSDADTIRFDDAQRRGVGTRFACETRLGPLHVTDRMTVTRWDPGNGMTVEHTGVVTGSGEFQIEPVNAVSSRFTWRETLSFPWYLGGPIGERAGGTAVLAAVWRRNLRTLKARVEAGE